jgi:hypothetical protein
MIRSAQPRQPLITVRRLSTLALALAATWVSAGTARAGLVPNGVNLQPSYYNGGNPNFGYSVMNAQTKIKSVRIEIEPDKVSQAKSWIAQAKSAGKTIIATYHKASVLGSDSASELATAGSWWRSNYATLAASGSFTVNLMNEWGSHNISSNSFASAYNTAISSVRSVYSGTIIVDASGWGQESHTMRCAITGCSGTKISDTKIAASMHIYAGGWNQGLNHWNQASDLDDMAAGGRACIIGEFGTGSGSADWAGITDAARNKGWSVLGWSWNGDGGSMNLVTPSWASNGGATSFSLSGYFSTVYNHL